MNDTNNYSQKIIKKRKKCAFLDRDGVLIKDYKYVYKENQIKFLTGTVQALKFLKNKKYKIVVITNQSGVGRGYFTENDVIKFHKILDKKISNKKIIDKYYYCPFHPTKAFGKYKKDSKLRKPNNGMIQKAIRELKIDASKSFMIGDKRSDFIAAKKSNIKFSYKKGSLLKIVKKMVKSVEK